MSNVFGNFLDKFKLSNTKEEDRINSNQIATEHNDGAIEIDADSVSQFAINLDWSYNSQVDLINTYRDVANYAIVDFAIDDIIGEMVSFDEEEEPIELDLSAIDDSELSENIKEKVYESWDKISTILDLKSTIHRRAKSFYTDGRITYQKVIDQNKPRDGILDVIELDPRNVTKLKKVRYDEQNKVIAEIRETIVYDENQSKRKQGGKDNNRRNEKLKTAFELNPESVVYVTSGLTDSKTGYTISWLHKAVKPANQLRMMENALVIYRITRAPERRIFYVDTANLPKSKAQQYIRSLKDNYKNRMQFDPDSGSFTDQRHLQTMQEDYWLPRNSSGRGTEVSTLPGGSNLSDIDDVMYFMKQLYKALNLPVSRLEPDSVVQFGRNSEISRDELKLSKLVSKIRKRFNMAFLDLLKTELILTKVIDIKEWDQVKHKVKFKYAQDLYLEETKQSEMIRERLDLLEQMAPYIGKYFSHEYARINILKQPEQEVMDIDKQIDKEKTMPQYQEPEEDSRF